MITFNRPTTISGQRFWSTGRVRLSFLARLVGCVFVFVLAVGAIPALAQEEASNAQPTKAMSPKPLPDGSSAKVIPIKAQFRDKDTEGLAGQARRDAVRFNSEARKKRNEARDQAKRGISDGNMQAVRSYFNGYIFPQMTQAEELVEASRLRDAFFRTFMKADVSAANRKRVIADVIAPAMQAIANGEEYLPAARLNAVALMGRLDDSPMIKSGSRTTPPRPSAVGLNFLSSLLEDASSPPWLKAAAVHGILRHLKVDQAVGGRLLTDGQRDVLETFAVNTLDDRTPGQDTWAADVNYWVKRRSVQLLGAIGRSGSNGSTVERLVAIVADQAQTPWMQLDAIRALRTINFGGVEQAKVSKAIVSLTDFVRKQLVAEDEHISALLDDLIYKNILYGDEDLAVTGTNYKKNVGQAGSGGMMGMMGMGGLDDPGDSMSGGSMGPGGSSGKGGSMMKSEPVVIVELPTYQLNLSRRKIKVFVHSVNDVVQNARGIKRAVSAKDKQLQEAIQNFTTTFMKDSDVGVIDVGKMEKMDPDEFKPQTESYTEQLQKVCRRGATSLRVILTRHAGGRVAPDSIKKDKPKDDDPFNING